jgi:two-component system chemotaxis sensor kinase CheA
MHEDPELVREFLIECHENLDQLDRDLVALEAAPRDAAILARIFRTLHTIKGSCAFLGFSKLGGVAHAGEQLLDKLRDGQFQINPTIANALLGTVDAIRTMLGCIESHGHDGAQEYASLVQTLGDLSSGKAPAPPPRATPAKVPSTADVVVRPSQAAIVWPATGPEPAGGSNTVVLAPQAGAPPAGPGTEPDEPSLLGVPAGSTAPPAEVPRPPPRAEPLGQSPAAPPRRRRPPRKPASATPPSEPPPPLPTPSAATAFGQSMFTTEGMAAPAEAAPAQVLDATIRLDVRVIDKLMTLVSELVLARNQVLQYSTSLDSATPGGAGFVGVTRALNLITTELQEQVMKTRMQPIDVVWSRFPRLVRDVARTCAKQVRLDVQGSETELDKTVIEAIRDPLTHLVRNAVDHGIETPELRRAKGKPPEGRLLLRAFHEAGQVNIEVADDGDGIDPARVRNRAVERKLLTPDQALQLSDEAAVALVFRHGRGQDERRARGWKLRRAQHGGTGHHRPHAHPAHVGHRQSAGRGLCRRALRRAPGEHRGTPAPRTRRRTTGHRTAARRARTAFPGPLAADPLF